MKRALKTVIVFSATGLLGPLILGIAYIFSMSDSIYDFINDLLFSFWPSQMLAVTEINIGTVNAVILASSVNVLLFATLGLIVTVFSKKIRHLIGIYLLVCVGVFIWTLWGAGFNFKYLNGYALLVAFSLYSIPFCIVGKWFALFYRTKG